jgi:hypothetical protein
VVTREQDSLVGRGSNKRHRQKGAHHAFEWEKLDNHDVQAEMDWKNETKE